MGSQYEVRPVTKESYPVNFPFGLTSHYVGNGKLPITGENSWMLKREAAAKKLEVLTRQLP